MKDIIISKLLKKNDGKCVLCEIKFRYGEVRRDEIVLAKRGLTSGYYMAAIWHKNNYGVKSIIFNNIEEAKKAALSEDYKNFKSIYIRKVSK